MKTLYLTDGGSNIILDKENDSCSRIDSQRECIQRIYLIEEPMHVTYQAGEYRKDLDVVEGDLLITFYSGDFKNRIVVAKSEDWAENLKVYNEEEQKRREEWAKKQAECDACPSCGDNCEALSKF